MNKAKVIAPDGLNREEAAQARLFIQRAKAPGVFVGALRGVKVSDIKPLLLDQGILKILRFSSQEFSDSSGFYLRFGENFSRALAHPEVTGWLAGGESENQLWGMRTFYQQCLIDVEDYNQLSAINFADKLIAVVQKCHRNGIVHGHLCRANIALHEGEPFLLDTGFAGFVPGVKTDPLFAPELRNGELPGLASDIFGLGLLIKDIKGGELSDEKFQLLEQMLHINPDLRPVVSKAATVFISESYQSGAKITPGPVVKAGEGMRLGKVISPKLPEAEEPKEEETPDETKEEDWVADSTTLEEAVEGLKSKTIEAQALPSDAQRLIKRVLPESPEQGSEETNSDDLAVSREESFVRRDTRKYKRPKKKIHTGHESQAYYGGKLFFLLMLLGIFALQFEPIRSIFIEKIPYREYWTSNLSSEMEQVALAAVLNNDIQAERVIVKDILGGNNRPGVRSHFMRVALNELWQAELTKQDRIIVLKLSMPLFLKDRIKRIPALNSLHPGILFAVIGSLKLEEGETVADILVSQLANLPAPVGSAFKMLEQLGISSFSDKSAHALAQILYERANYKALSSYFSETDDVLRSVGKMKILLLLPNEYQIPPERLLKILRKQEGLLSELARWFDRREHQYWKDIPDLDKAQLISGSFPKSGLGVKHYIDLFKFPLSTIAQEAKEGIITFIPEEKRQSMIDTAVFLASSENRLSNEQTALLLESMKFDKESEYTVLSAWFKSEPNPSNVATLLIARKKLGPFDPFNVEGARYLKDKEWEVDRMSLRRMSTHPVELVRSLAYAKLDASKPKDAQLLKRLLEVELNPTLKKEIKWKLENEAVKGK